MGEFPILTTVDELRDALETERLAYGGPVRLLDVRWRLDRPDGRPDYLAGHIPGALYVDLDTELAAHGDPRDGRHPLPSIESLQDAARSWGIDPGDTVVVYDDFMNLSSARAWWLLRHAGIDDVRLLDGSLRAWTDAGSAVETGEATTPVPGTVALSYGHLPTIELDEVPGFVASGVLLDARNADRYRGDVEPVDPRAGHIPGAVSAPTAANVDDRGRFLSAAALRSRFSALGVTEKTPVGTYCGSGVTAAHEAAALMLAGFTPALFAGSWSQWSNHAELPVATGS